MSQRAKSKVGQTLGRTYRIERLVGVGSVGAVYVARHQRTGALCAVKVLHRKLGPTGEAYTRFVEETRTIGLLRHPHILPFSDFDHDDSGALFLVMELLEGESLQQRLQQKGGLPLSPVQELAKQIGGALHAAHRSGVLHRNVRPENIFLARHDLGDHMSEVARLMDFGLGRLRRPPGAEVTGPGADVGEGGVAGRGTLLGLSQYTAPEVALHPGGAMDAKADQWGLAVVLYRALAGRLPFAGESLREVLRNMTEEAPAPLGEAAPELPPHVVQAVTRAMARDPKERFDTVQDLVRALSDRPSRIPAISGALAEVQSRPALLIASADEISRPPTGETRRPPSGEAPRPVTGPAPAVQDAGARPSSGRRMLFAGAALLVLASSGATVWLMNRSGSAVTLASARQAEPAPAALAAAPAAVASEPPPATAAPGPATVAVAAAVPVGAPPVTASPPAPAPAPPSTVSPPSTASAPTPAPAPPPTASPPSTASAPAPALAPPPAASPPSTASAPTPAPAPSAAASPPAAAPTLPPAPVAPAAASPAPPVARAQRVPRPQRADDEAEPPRSEDPAAQGKSSVELLREAQGAYAEGDKPRAISLALSAATRPGDTQAAWRFLGSAACQVRDSRLATRAYRHLDAADRQFVLGVCQRQGLDYLNNEFRLDPWP